MDSFRLPKGTDEENVNRRKSIREATLQAAQIPFDTACLALEQLKVLLRWSLMEQECYF